MRPSLPMFFIDEWNNQSRRRPVLAPVLPAAAPNFSTVVSLSDVRNNFISLVTTSKRLMLSAVWSALDNFFASFSSLEISFLTCFTVFFATLFASFIADVPLLAALNDFNVRVAMFPRCAGRRNNNS